MAKPAGFRPVAAAAPRLCGPTKGAPPPPSPAPPDRPLSVHAGDSATCRWEGVLPRRHQPGPKPGAPAGLGRRESAARRKSRLPLLPCQSALHAGLPSGLDHALPVTEVECSEVFGLQAILTKLRQSGDCIIRKSGISFFLSVPHVLGM